MSGARTISLAAILALSLLTLSCTRKQEDPLTAVVVSDLSASIEPEARLAMFRAIESLVSGLHRGDSLTIIPVTGDAENDPSAAVLRFELPTEREVYDDDLRRVGSSARKSLEKMAEGAMKSPGSRTDLLGALRIATEELAGLPPSRSKIVIVLSDFIQDDDQFDFKRDPGLAHRATAKELADQLAERGTHPFTGAALFLGYLKSHDQKLLSRERREAIRAFWLEYVTRLGGRPYLVLDGPGLLPRFLQVARSGAGDHS